MNVIVIECKVEKRHNYLIFVCLGLHLIRAAEHQPLRKKKSIQNHDRKEIINKSKCNYSLYSNFELNKTSIGYIYCSV